MANLVLRALARKPEQTRHDRIALDLQRLHQRVLRDLDQLFVGLLQAIRIAPAAQKPSDEREAVRRAAGPFRADPGGRQQGVALDARDHEARSFERMADLIAAVPEGDGRGGGVRHRVAQARQGRVEAAQQPPGRVRRETQDDRARLQRRSRGFDRKERRAMQLRHACGEPYRPWAQRVRQRIDQLADAAGQRDECALRRRRDLQRAQRSKDATGLPFGVNQPRKQRPHREALGVAGVDSGQQRLGKIVERLLAEPAPDKRRNRLVISAAARHHDLARHAKLARPAEEGRPRERTKTDREAEKGSFDERTQPAVAQHVRRPGKERRDQPVA